MIDLQEYLKRTSNILQQGGNSSYYAESNNGYSSGQQTQQLVKVNSNREFSPNLPDSVYNKDGSVNYKKLESHYRSRNNVSEVMTGWSPMDKNVHVLSGTSDHYEWNQPILHGIGFSDAVEKLQSSSSIMSADQIDEALYYNISNEYQGQFAEMLDKAKGYSLHEKFLNLIQHGSGIMTSADFQELSTAMLNARMVTKTTKANILSQFFETIPTNELVIPFEEFDGPTVQEDLGEIEIPRTVQGKYTGFSIGLKKDGWHIAWTRFFEGQNRTRNVLQDHLNALRDDFGRVMNERIALRLTALADVAASSWSSFAVATDIRHQNNPRTVINTTRKTMKDLGYPVEFSLSNLRVAQDYINNTYVNGPYNQNPNQMGEEQVIAALPQYGWRHGIDDVLVDSSMFLLNRNVGAIVQGAVINITYVENKSQVFGAIGYNHSNFAIKKTEAGRQLTGIV